MNAPSDHRWSGWPGAWCLDCGVEDQAEACVADHAVWVDEGSTFDPAGDLVELKGRYSCPTGEHAPMGCEEPMSRRFDPYYRADPLDLTVDIPEDATWP